jgi:hypothetical protein
MADLRIAVLSIKAGQGTSTWAAALAWEVAATQRVVAIDADGSGGRLARHFGLTAARSLRDAYGAEGIPLPALRAQEVEVPDRPTLRVVPGFGRPCPAPPDALVRLLDPGLRELEADVSVVDLGTPLRYWSLTSAVMESTAKQIAETFQQTFVVVRAEDEALDVTVRTLRSVTMPRTRLVVARSRHGSEMGIVREVLSHLPDHPVAYEWEWNVKAMEEARALGQPLHVRDLPERLGLRGVGTVVEETATARRPGLLRTLGQVAWRRS